MIAKGGLFLLLALKKEPSEPIKEKIKLFLFYNFLKNLKSDFRLAAAAATTS